MIKIDYHKRCFFNRDNNYILSILSLMHSEKVVYSSYKPDYFYFEPKSREFTKQHRDSYLPGAIKILGTGEGPKIHDISTYNPKCAHVILSPNETKGINVNLPFWVYDIDWFNERNNGYYNYPTSYIEPLVTFTNRPIVSKSKFATYIAKNGGLNGLNLREDFTKYIIDNYKHVDCPGKSLHNCEMNNGIPLFLPKYIQNSRYTEIRPGNKQEWLKKYKFSIAFENHYSPYYVTEKILQSFATNTIPVYWGSDTILKDFNENAFIYAGRNPNFKDVLKQIKYVDESNDLFNEMQSQPLFKHNDYTPEVIVDKIRNILN